MTKKCNSSLLNCRFCNGMMMLPYYYRMIQNVHARSFLKKNSLNISKYQVFIRLLKGLSMLKIRKSDILIFSTTIHNFKIGGNYVNTLVGDYYNLYRDRTMLIEDADRDFRWRTNKSYPNLSFINSYILIFAKIMALISHKIKYRRNDDFKLFIEQYPMIFNTKVLSKADYFVSYYSFAMRMLLRYTQAKLIILQCASYGCERAVTCKVAHEMGIKVVEPQHGSTIANQAYEKSCDFSREHEYYDYLPDCIFTFGDYWEKYITWDYEKYSVGHAYLNRFLLERKCHDPQYDFLIVSQPLEDYLRDDFIIKLSHLYTNCKILIRFHPSEKQKVYSDCPNISISEKSSLYEDIDNCKFIIGWYSTCLIEAIAFGKVPIIVDCDITRRLFPHDIGYWVKKPEDLNLEVVQIISANTDFTSYWAENFVNRVKNYIDSILL